MAHPLVSVIIPAYRQSQFVGATIQSVLNQSYPHFEILVVNDASPDDTSETVLRFGDPRIKLIVHPENRGLPASRNTGIRAAEGDLIALLDADDLFHEEKLERHVNFLEQHPDIGVTYNARFELNHSAETIRELRWPAMNVVLADFVLGFPFAPSDMVLRKEWALTVGLFGEQHRHGAEDLDFPCRLLLAGCQFAGLDRALNYRRHHSRRFRKDIEERMADATDALMAIFSDPRCPSDVRDLRQQAFANHHFDLAFHAFAQARTELGQKHIRAAVQLYPAFSVGQPSNLWYFLLRFAIDDDSLLPEEFLLSILGQLPRELAFASAEKGRGVAEAYWIKGCRAMLWDRTEEGTDFLRRAAALDAVVYDRSYGWLIDQIHNISLEFGSLNAEQRSETLIACFEKLGGHRWSKRLRAETAFRRAFEAYRIADHRQVRTEAFAVIRNAPFLARNRGLLAILTRSVLGRRRISS